MYSRRHYPECVLEESRSPRYVQKRRRKTQPLNRVQPGFFSSSTLGLRPKNGNPAENSHGCRIGTSLGVWERLHVIDSHSSPFAFRFSSTASLSSVFACLRELSLLVVLFHGFIYTLFLLTIPRLHSQFSIRAIAVNWPPSFLASAIYDFILGQIDRRRYNTTALLSLDWYTTPISMSTSTLEPLRGSCSCGRNRYLIRILDDNVTDHAQIHFDSSSDNRASDYTLPLLPLLYTIISGLIQVS